MQRKLPSKVLSQREKILWLKSKTQQEGECWVWLDGLHSQGYGRISTWLHKSQAAHRAMYELAIGPIGKFHVLHECDNKKCINPSHLWLGTQIENIKDMQKKKRNLRHKLTDEDVMQIRRFKLSGITQSELSSAFGVSRQSIWKIISGASRVQI